MWVLPLKMDTISSIFVTWALLVLAGLCAAKFTQMPENVAINRDLIATFRCQGQAGSDANVAWAWSNSSSPAASFTNIGLNGDVYVPDTRYKINYNVSTALSVLRLEGVLISDVGFFRCQLFASSLNAYAQLVVLESDPQCASNMSLNDTMEGEGYSLSCAINYHSIIPWAPTMTWRDNIQGPLSSVNQTTSSQAKYTYSSLANRTMEGTQYQCETVFPTLSKEALPEPNWQASLVMNYSYVYTYPMALHVQYPVQNIRLDNSKAEYNPSDKVTCSAKGMPGPSYYWENVMTNATVNGNILTITTTMQGPNNWTCTAYNTIRGLKYELELQHQFIVTIPTTTTTTTQSTTTTKVTSAPTEPGTEGGLSGGAIAGIVIGSLAGLVLILLLILCCIRRNKAPKNEKQQKALHADTIRPPPQMVLPPDAKPQNDLSFVEKGPPPYNMYAPPSIKTEDGLVYADLAFEDKPRSRRPIQVYENPTDYDDLL